MQSKLPDIDFRGPPHRIISVMSLAKLSLALAFILWSSSALFAAEVVQKYSTEKKTPSVEVRIALAAEPEASDSPLKVTIHNVGSEALTIMDALNDLYRCRISIESSDGKRCPYTKRGSTAFPDPLHDAGSMRTERIAPGSEFTFTIYLEDFFQLTPGKWLLKCQVPIYSHVADRSVELPPKGSYLNI